MLHFKLSFSATKTCGLILLFISCFNVLKSQVRMEATGYDHKDNATGYAFYGMASLPNKDRVPYSRIKGSPFLKDELQLATLYAGTLKLSTMPIRLNLVTNKIHIFKDEKEVALETGNISTIVFHLGNDISKTSEIFIVNDPYMFLQNKKVEGFVQVLNSGNHRLLKYMQRKVSSSDSLFGTQKKYFFTDDVFYYIWYNEKIERIKKLNKDNVIKFLPSESAYAAWIDENKIDFKKESDVLRFLNHYNPTSSANHGSINNQK